MSSLPLLTPKRFVFAFLVGLLIRIRFDWQFRRKLVQAVIATSVGKTCMLYLARFLLGHALPPLLINFYSRWPTNYAQDGLPYFDHLKYVRRTRFGPHPRDEMDELLPVQGQVFEENRTPIVIPNGMIHLGCVMSKTALQFLWSGFDHHPHSVPKVLGRVRDECPAILFGHGGGWVVPGTDVQLLQTPAVARGADMALFPFNYPLAPEDPFPAAVISSLRAMSYLKSHRGYDAVALLGESAGGNLITMAAMFVCNPKLMRRLALASNTDCDTWDYPRISCVVSWYSILDHEKWRDAGKDAWLWTGLETVWEMYLGDTPKMDGKATVCQWETEIEIYPPTLIICGSYDPLGLNESSKEFYQVLQRLNVPAKLSFYKATHGFVGYPPAMQTAINNGDPSHWLENCAAATKETTEWLRKYHGHEKRTRVLGG